MIPWVLLRGLTREAGHWGDFPQRLSGAMGGVRVICIDLPGNGELYQEDSPLSVEAMAEHCHAQLSALSIPHPCRVLAMSLGAMVAVAWGQRHPADIDAAILINTSMRPFSPFHQRLRSENYLHMISLLVRRPPAQDIERTILDMTSRTCWTPEAQAAILAEWARYRNERPVSAVNTLRQLIAAARYRAPERPPAIPLQLLVSRGDRLVDSRCSDTLAAIWGAGLSVHPSAGHDLPLDDPEWVIGKVRELTLRRPTSADF